MGDFGSGPLWPGRIGGTPLGVLHVVGVSIDGGVPVYVRELACRQYRAGQAVAVACRPGSVLWQMLSEDGLAEILIPLDIGCEPRRVAPASVQLRAIAADLDPAVVHLHSSCAGLVGRVALAGLPMKRVFQPHCWSFHAVPASLRLLAQAFEWGAAGRADLVLCGSESERHELAVLGFEPSRTDFVVVPNFVDTTRFRPMDRSSRQRAQLELLGSVAPTVVSVGRLAHQKGIDRLVAAFARVTASIPDARLVLVGDGPGRQRYESQAGTARNIQFVGYSDEPERWMELADVGVYPSRYDTMSLAVLETLSCGVPVVVSGAGGMAEILHHVEFEAGEVVTEAGQPDVLGASIVRWLEHNGEAGDPRLAARRRAIRFDASDWFDAMTAVYAKLSPALDPLPTATVTAAASGRLLRAQPESSA